MNNDGSRKGSWVVFGSALALIPALAYALAFVYELAWFEVFGLPKEFIAIDWTKILIAAGAFAGTSIVVLSFVYLPIMLRQMGFLAKPGPLKGRIVQHSVVLFLLTSIFARYAAFIPNLALIYFLPVYKGLIDFVFPLLSQRNVPGYRNKLEAEDSRVGAPAPDWWRKYSRMSLGLGMVLLTFFIIASNEGRRRAMTQTTFLIPSTHPQSVVLRVYGDILVGAPFDQLTRTVERSFFFIRLGDSADLRLTPRGVGPLRSVR